jgi:hypothetical protein
MIPPYNGQSINKDVNIELGHLNEFQLYHLKKDIGQKNNLAKTNPEKLNAMLAAFEAIRGKNYGKIENLILK